MSDFEVFLAIEFGILASLAIPWARAVIARARQVAQGQSADETPLWKLRLERAWDVTKPYLVFLLASSVVGFVVLMGVRRMQWELNTFYDAFFVGFFADTILAKVLREGPNEG